MIIFLIYVLVFLTIEAGLLGLGTHLIKNFSRRENIFYSAFRFFLGILLVLFALRFIQVIVGGNDVSRTDNQITRRYL